MADDLVSLSLTPAAVELLVEALDSHEYWPLSDPTWRHSGYVRLPGEQLDPLAGPDELTVEQRVAIPEIEACRRLQDSLRAAVRSMS